MSYRQILTLAILGCGLVSAPVRAQENGDAASSTDTSTEALERLGAALERDWEDSPEWARMASAMLQGEPMGPGMGWWQPSRSRYDWQWLRESCGAGEEGGIRREAFPGTDAAFDVLDRNDDEVIRPGDLNWSQPPRNPDPASRAAGQWFHLLDGDSNGKITPEELTAFFRDTDRQESGFLTVEDLQRAFTEPRGPVGNADEYRPGRDRLRDIEMLMAGELGSLTDGPRPGDEAPDFTLPLQGFPETVTLSAMRGKPVVLIFGSFT